MKEITTKELQELIIDGSTPLTLEHTPEGYIICHICDIIFDETSINQEIAKKLIEDKQ